MDREDITAEVAARLVAEQFPQWADLPVTPVSLNGWDNTTFRLGDNLSIRLPSGEGYAGAVAKEQRWLPELGPQLPLPIPQPVTVGRPGGGYPWSWSIYRWLQGTPASLAEIADWGRFAADLADFLTALYAIDASSGPPAGPDSAYRGCPLTPLRRRGDPGRNQVAARPDRSWPGASRVAAGTVQPVAAAAGMDAR